MDTTNTKPMADLEQFDAVGQASKGHKFEVMDPAGNPYPTPFYFIVQGRQSAEVTKHYRRLVDEHMRKQQLASRRGKPAEPKTGDEIFEDNVSGAVVRLIGWEGVSNPFDREVARRAIRRNPHWIDQITEESDDLGNFTK